MAVPVLISHNSIRLGWFIKWQIMWVAALSAAVGLWHKYLVVSLTAGNNAFSQNAIIK